MAEQPAHFTIKAQMRRAIWPGGRAVCVVMFVPGFLADTWLLGSGETGAISELRAYRYGMFGDE